MQLKWGKAFQLDYDLDRVRVWARKLQLQKNGTVAPDYLGNDQMYWEDQIPEDEVEVVDDGVPLDFLLKIIQELPDRYRLVFNLYVMDGYSHKEIAEIMNIAESTSRSQYQRARKLLQAWIKQLELH